MEYVRLGDLYSISKGKKVEELEIKHDAAIRYIQIEDLRNNNNLKYCLDTDKYVKVTENDIIIAWDGANAGTIGYGLKGAIGSTLAALKTDSQDIYPKYIGYYLSSKSQYLRDTCTGATIPHIQRSILESIKIPLLSLEEQIKVSNILDQAQELIDKRKAQIEALDELIQSVFYDMFGDPILNSKKLPVISLGDLGEWRSGGTPSRSCSEYYNGDIPWLSSGELNSIYVYDSMEKITEDAIENSSTKMIEKGSLLLGMYDTAALKSTITKIDCACNQAIAFSKLNDSLVNTIFVYYCIQFGRDFYKSQQRGVRQKNLNLSMIKDIQILYPNLSQQYLFTEKVHQIHKQKELLNESLVELENNFNSLMQRAFSGGSLR